MVPEHILRQQLYHHLNPQIDDMRLNVEYVEESDTNLRHRIIDYFFNKNHKISYPSKSYAVAIIYSHLLELCFDVPFKDSIRDPELLFNNDPYYQPYDNKSEIYDIVLRHIKLEAFPGLQYHLPQVNATVNYFNEEFFIIRNPYFNNANLHK